MAQALLYLRILTSFEPCLPRDVDGVADVTQIEGARGPGDGGGGERGELGDVPVLQPDVGGGLLAGGAGVLVPGVPHPVQSFPETHPTFTLGPGP